MQSGNIYVLINSAQPGKVKIGKTTKDPLTRAAELSSASGVLGYFDVFFSIECDDIDHVENLVHHALKDYRVQRNREFFNITPEKAATIVKRCAFLLENVQSEQVEANHQNDLQESNRAGVRIEKSKEASGTLDPVSYSYKSMGNQTSTIGLEIPYNFYTRRISTKCSRCAEEFSQTLSRGEKKLCGAQRACCQRAVKCGGDLMSDGNLQECVECQARRRPWS
jgi:hypothetical protein